MTIHYMNGAGNDFMVMDARGGKYDFEKLAVELCKLTKADGFMAVDHSDKADFKLHFYNSDGTRGEMCGNGARCICRYAHDMGIAGDTVKMGDVISTVGSTALVETVLGPHVHFSVTHQDLPMDPAEFLNLGQ